MESDDHPMGFVAAEFVKMVKWFRKTWEDLDAGAAESSCKLSVAQIAQGRNRMAVA